MRQSPDNVRAAELRAIASRLLLLAEIQDQQIRKSYSPAEHSAEKFSDLYLATIASEELSLHHKRCSHIDSDLLGEPVWNILLDLFVARVHGRDIMVTSACIASCAPMTTALRYLTVLEQRGMISRRDSRFDARMHYVELTDEALEAMRAALMGFARVRRGDSPAAAASASVFRFEE